MPDNAMEHTTPHHTTPHTTIPYTTSSYHTVPYHTISYHTKRPYHRYTYLHAYDFAPIYSHFVDESSLQNSATCITLRQNSSSWLLTPAQFYGPDVVSVIPVKHTQHGFPNYTFSQPCRYPSNHTHLFLGVAVRKSWTNCHLRFFSGTKSAAAISGALLHTVLWIVQYKGIPKQRKKLL